MATRSLITPRYTRPLFRLQADPLKSRQSCINVSSILEVSRRGRDSEAHVVVSATLFTVMRQLRVSLESTVSMYLEDDGPRLLFGIMVDGHEVHDLWHYTRDQIPDALLV